MGGLKSLDGVNIEFHIRNSESEYTNQRYIKLYKLIGDDSHIHSKKVRLHFLKQSKLNFNIKSNSDLPLLDREVGGVGYDSNINDKHLRFNDISGYHKSTRHNTICFILCNSIDDKSIWTFKEIKDIIQGISLTMNDVSGLDDVIIGKISIYI